MSSSHRWALRADVRVTLIYSDPDKITSIYLVEAVQGRADSIVLSFEETDFRINGVLCAPPDNELARWCSLADAVALAPDLQPGTAVTTYALTEDEVRA
jgi:hypothetical protein